MQLWTTREPQMEVRGRRGAKGDGWMASRVVFSSLSVRDAPSGMDGRSAWWLGGGCTGGGGGAQPALSHRESVLQAAVQSLHWHSCTLSHTKLSDGTLLA